MPPEKLLRTVVVDDEELARRRICRLLQHDSAVAVVAECADGNEAVNLLLSEPADLVFLDVQMPGLNGFDVLRAIPSDRLPLVIFVTAHDHYAMQAFEAHAVDYLLKPFRRERFHNALEWAKSRASLRDLSQFRGRMGALSATLSAPRLVIRDGRGTILLRHDEIVWIESANNYSCFHCVDKTYIVRETLSSLERRLENSTLFRIHRSAIVNASYVVEIRPAGNGDHRILLRQGDRLTLSRTYAETLTRLRRLD